MKTLDKMYLDVRLDNNEIITVAIKNNSVALSHYTDYGDLNTSMVMSIPAILATEKDAEAFIVLSIAQEMMLDTIHAYSVFKHMMRGIVFYGVSNKPAGLLGYSPTPDDTRNSGPNVTSNAGPSSEGN